ncbi:hypothetical protein H0H93_003294 [Arthromyces matolae]|nr:hypothetical protein H0H93_003294 [Arthromyces matolae]
MKPIIFHLSLIGAALLACAIPTVFDPKTLVKRNALALPSSISINAPSNVDPAVGLDAPLSSSTHLTRREPPIMTKSPRPFVPKFNYETPLYFFHSLNLLRGDARRRRIAHWASNRVTHLAAMVEEIKAFDAPNWLVIECRGLLKQHLQLVDSFLPAERTSRLLPIITQHKKDVEDLIESVPEQARDPAFSGSEEEESSCKEPENQTHGVQGPPNRDSNPKRDTSPHVTDLKVNERHIKARRKRIDQWHTDGVNTLKAKLEKLPRLGYPSWLVHECRLEILWILSLIDHFKKEEMDKGYYKKITDHDVVIRRFQDDFSKKIEGDFYYRHLRILVPKIEEGGPWRQLVTNLVGNVKDLPTYNTADAQIQSGLHVFDNLKLAAPPYTPTDQIERFMEFLHLQTKLAKEKLGADKPGIVPTSTQSS